MSQPIRLNKRSKENDIETYHSQSQDTFWEKLNMISPFINNNNNTKVMCINLFVKLSTCRTWIY